MMSKIFVAILACLVLALTISISNAQLPEGCVCATTDNYDPVCGNDGVTYSNFDELKCTDACVKHSIHLMHHGPC